MRAGSERAVEPEGETTKGGGAADRCGGSRVAGGVFESWPAAAARRWKQPPEARFRPAGVSKAISFLERKRLSRQVKPLGEKKWPCSESRQAE
jgi:hypothetical protein